MANDRPIVFDDDNPEWTEADFARARPASEVLPPEIVAQLVRRRGRPAGSGKTEMVTIRLDREVLAKFRAGGRGWQTRINEALKRSA